MKLLSSRITKDFNYNPDLGIADFTANHMENEIMWEMFRNMVHDDSKLSPMLRPRLLGPDEFTCQASWDGEVALYIK